ncbi:hypothetical protein M758_6G018700 [Ceratodon purpureus]|uniref:Uncharacterized protein n=1 Tax=Ceratodon purpureus TaxID=3225 RepID=A0A8T0HEA6_CERPU|nr:hypothetical protein KC19_6G021400 [Ceratodon purpureus]KAG0612321.1 hypothetical protein M758_6G018700 [Ceratodon purpureus]
MLAGNSSTVHCYWQRCTVSRHRGTVSVEPWGGGKVGVGRGQVYRLVLTQSINFALLCIFSLRCITSRHVILFLLCLLLEALSCSIGVLFMCSVNLICERGYL